MLQTPEISTLAVVDNTCPTYQQYPTIPIHLSFSGVNLLRDCPRQFELVKYLNFKDREKSIHFDYGSAVGTGAQELLAGASVQDAIIKASMEWELNLDNEYKRKNWGSAYYAIVSFQDYIDEYFPDWELMWYLNKEGVSVPAIEVPLRIQMEGGITYVGFIDLVLRNKATGEISVFDIKTTGSSNIQPSMKQNSEQALGYAVILRELFNVTSFNVYYLMLKVSTILPQWMPPMMFKKTAFHRLSWLYDLITEQQTINLYTQLENFPKHGNNCYSFGRECTFLGRCDADNASVYTAKPTEVPKHLIDTEWAVDVHIDKLIDSAIADWNIEQDRGVTV